jgi:hypothetical protein
LSGGGALVQNRVWVNGTIRRWIVNKLVNARNADGSQALDDNDLKNYSGKLVTQLTTNNKFAISYLWNDKIRGHRRDDATQIIPDIASVVQTNPVQTTQAKYTGIRGALVFESNFSIMDGQTNYTYQPDTAPDAIRYVDIITGEVRHASTREEHQPNSRHQFDNAFTWGTSGFGGEHLLKAGVQWGRLYYSSDYSVQGDHYVEYSSGVPTRVRQFNTPVVSENIARVLGFFVQDAWSMNRLTLNVGGRWDKYDGEVPAQERSANRFIGPATFPEKEIKQNRGVWRLGASYDLTGSGRTALKASYSRYALQVGIDRVTNINPLSNGSRTCPWTDPNGDGKFQDSEITVSQCSAFSGGATTNYAPGIRWPYSDELTGGVETQLAGAVRVGAMFYYRTNKDQFGDRNEAVPSSAYTQHNVTIPNSPGGGPGTTNLKPISVPVWNLPASLASADQTIRDNRSELDTEYKGIEFTATKRFSSRWQMQAGFTIGKNEGGFGGADLNDPNLTRFPRGIIGNDSERAFRLSGSYRLPGDVNLAGSMLANNGYPYVSTYSLSRATAATQGITLTRATQTITLSERGDERLPNVTMIDLRLSRPFRFGSRSFQPTIDFFNVTNTDTRDNQNSTIGASYLLPTSILSPRIIRIGFSLNF